MLEASWYKCKGQAGTSVRGELVQMLGASWFKCYGQAGSNVKGKLVQVLGASWYKCWGRFFTFSKFSIFFIS